MSETYWIPAGAPCKKPSEHEPGSLLALSSGSDVHWALRFDDEQDSQVVPYLYLLTENNLGASKAHTALRCHDFNIDNLAVAGFAPSTYDVRVEFASGDWISDNKMSWYDAKGHVAFGEFGARLCGYDQFGPNGLHIWIDCNTWKTDANMRTKLNSRSRVVTAYAPTWRVVARRKDEDLIAVAFSRLAPP